MYEIPDTITFEKPSRLAPAIANEEEKKRLFGIEIAKGLQPFEAACNVCGQDNTSVCLYIAQRWLNDPVVIGSRDLYLKTVDSSKSLLDADQLAAKLLAMSEEKNVTQTFYMLEGKDRIKCLELYAEIKGFTGKLAIDNSTKNFTFKQMLVKFVSPDKKETVIDQLPNDEIINPNRPPPLKLKLVS